MYQVLYRKWRPRVFEDVAGQPQVTVTLKNELKSGRIAHAYLFTGSRGTGKTTCAKILAKAVNCEQPKDGDPCGVCDTCKGLDSGSILDVVEIDAASNNGVDNIRDLREEANFTPVSAKYRVYIIDEVHMLSTGAFNALLKTLEEPPEHVLFILATTEVHKLPATILSRCQRFDFHRIAPEQMKQRLDYVAQQEHATLTEEAALLIARLSDGALRDALSLLDQCISKSSDVTAELVSQTAGLAQKDYLFELATAMREQNSGDLLSLMEKLHAMSSDMERLCEELIGFFRNLMIIQSVKEHKSLIVGTQGELELLQKEAAGWSSERVLYCLDVLQDALNRLRRQTNPRVEMEMTLIRLCRAELDGSKEALLARIAALEEVISGSGPIKGVAKQSNPVKTPTAVQTKADPTTPTTPTTLTASQASDEPALVTEWAQVLAELAKTDKLMAGFLNGSKAYYSGKFVLIDSSNSMFLDLVKQPTNKENLRQAILKVTGKNVNLGPYKRTETEWTAPKQDNTLDRLAQQARELGIAVTIDGKED